MPGLQSVSKKRPAVSQGGPKSKKHQSENPSLTKLEERKVQKRSRPVTQPIIPASGLSDDDEDDDEDNFEEEEPEDQEIVPDEMIVDGASIRDPNAARESHKVQRVLQEQRRAAKPHSQLLADAKRVWSLARQKSIPSAERQKHVKELMKVTQGKHDASRIIQTVVKYGGQKERDQVAMELKGHYKSLAQSKYSKFLVTKLIRLCPAHRASILLEFQSNVLRLLLHREASAVLADSFELYANAYERSILLRDFYGKEVALFSQTQGSEPEKANARKGFPGVLEGLEGERRKRVLAALKENLTTIFNNSDKGAITHAIVHRALLEYLAAINDTEDESEREKLRKEIFERGDVLAEMVHTKDGSRVVRDFIAYGTAKDRKQIIKVIKPHVERMCTDDEAQLVLFTALDVIDDTKLTAKSLVSDITTHAPTLINTPQGRRALFYLLVPRSRRHFTPAQIAIIADTDLIRSKTSKKSAVVREGEIRAAASEGLLKFVEDNGAEAARDTGGSLVVLEIMLYADGDKSSAMQSLLQPLASIYPSEDASKPHPIDLPHTSRMYKSLFQGGHFSHASKSVVRSSSFSPSAFASEFMSIVGQDLTVSMAGGEGAFIIAEFLQRIKEEGSADEKQTVKGWFGGDVVERLKKSETKGRNVLLDKINALLL
ncbi:armadillo-type protein [Suillus fuscotomentosus]|uniref:Armadillo-type protein n=1 Tax=Suillus fuscotomentosus TaxID=1912939 RepID=A0AAD4HJG0_9AGAM|nr:armadillo-type protein [Suillus fuscotomentosus]KAG1898767.1 armadillo-type protein [Suillus fuscotomentosus]